MDMAISHIEMGYLVTLPLVRGLRGAVLQGMLLGGERGGVVRRVRHAGVLAPAQLQRQGLTLVHFRLNISAFYGIRGALRNCLGVVLLVFGRCQGVLGGAKGVFCVRHGSG